MALNTETCFNRYAGSGTAGPFPYEFKIWEENEIEVIRTDSNGLETVLARDIDYTVSGAGEDSGGSVTLAQALPAGYTLTIRSFRPYIQQQSYADLNAFSASSHNNSLDKLARLDQQQNEILQRVPRFRKSCPDSLRNLTWPDLAPNRIFGTDASGAAIVLRDPAATLSIPAIDHIGNYGDSLSTAVAEIGAGSVNLLVNRAITVHSSLTVPKNILLWVAPGGRISGPVNLTIGSIEAGPWQIFGSDITVAFSDGAAVEAYPQWWLGASIGSALLSGARVVRVPDGAYESASTIAFAFDGQGLIASGGASLSYTGTGTAVSLNGRQHCSVEGLAINTASGAVGIDVPALSHFFGVRRCVATGFSAAGISLASSFYGSIADNDVHTNAVGIRLTNGANGNCLTGNSIRQNLIGVLIDDTGSSPNGNSIMGNDIESSRIGSTYAIKCMGGDSNMFVGNRLEYSVGTAHVLVDYQNGVAQFNEFIGNQILGPGTVPAYILGDGIGSGQVVSTFISGGRGAGAVTINSDAQYTMIVAPRNSYGGALTDNGDGSVVLLDPINQKYYVKNALNKALDWVVGGSATILKTGSNYLDVNVNGAAHTRFNADGSLYHVGTAWNKPLRLGSHYLWVDSSSRLRIKAGAPASDTDGTVVGMQTG